MTKIYFKQILKTNPDEIVSGHITFDEENDTHEIMYLDALWNIQWSYVPNGVSDEMLEAIAGFDLAEYCGMYEEDEFGIYDLDKFTLVINPQEITSTLLDTLIHYRTGYSDCIWEGSLPRRSGADLLDELCGTWNLYVKTSPMTANVYYRKTGYDYKKLLKVHYGDSEIAEAVESAISRIEGMTMSEHMN